MKRRAGFTLIELIVAIAIVLVLGAVAYAAYAGIEAKSRDNAAIALADQYAANLQHYAALNGGVYPASMNECWLSGLQTLGSNYAEFATNTYPPIFAGGTAGYGCLFLVVTDAAGSTFSLEFRAVGGTGTVYCKDPNGLLAVTGTGSSWTAQSGLLSGCP